MKIKHQDCHIEREHPFTNCKLGREKYAIVLTQIVGNYKDGFVLAINNEWGTGKTTFVKMWQQQLINKGYNTLYFNSWENDFDANPLVAIMSELKTLTKNESKTFKSLVSKGAVLTKNVLPQLLKILSKKYVGTEDIADLVKDTAEGVSNLLADEIKEYSEKKKGLKDFKEDLEKYIAETNAEKPLIFFVDELDRCRPNYAVELLEQIKHLFSVSGIVFVLSIDKSHLASSVKGYYGSSDINTEEYLRRFIDLEYSIPQPSNEAFINYLFDYYSFKDFYSSEERTKFTVFNKDSDALKTMAIMLFNHYPATLRQQERIFALTRVSLTFFKENQYTFSNLLFFLIYLKTLQNPIYTLIDNKNYSLQKLMDITSDILSPIATDKQSRYFTTNLQAMLVHFYNNDLSNYVRLFDIELQNQKITTNVKAKFDIEGFLGDSLIQLDRNSDYSNLKLSFLLNKINLTAAIN